MKDHAASFPPLGDLGAEIGSARWWLDFAKCLSGIMLVLWLFTAPGSFSGWIAALGQPQGADDNEAVNAPDPTPRTLVDKETLLSIGEAIAVQVPHAPMAAPLPEDQIKSTRTQTAKVRRGTTLMDTIAAAGVSRTDAYQAIAALDGMIDPRRIAVNQELVIEIVQQANERRLRTLMIRGELDQRYIARRDKDGFVASAENLPVTKLTAYGEGTITDNLYLSAHRAGVPASVIVDMIRILSWDIDFQREIRAGDRFEVIYERIVVEEDAAQKHGDVRFIRMNLRGKPLTLYRFRPENGRVDYFDESGQSARKALLATPVDGARLTSSFGRRKHPVLGYTRVHKGLDFGAPTGTPIMAAGDGVIERASRWGSFGNYVRIRHNDRYKTAYAHLSKYGRGIKVGKRVQQGDIIGYVGATGRVTGPHLHFEVLRDGVQVNPRRLNLPSGLTLAGNDRHRFELVKNRLLADQKSLQHSWQIAIAPAIDTAP